MTSPDQRNHRRARRLRAVVLILLLGAFVAVVVRSGVIGDVSDQERLADTVAGAGVWGPAVYVGLMVLLVPLNVPGLLFVIPATTLFGTVAGIALALTGGFLASAVGILGVRRFGREAIRARVPDRILRWEARLVRRGFWGVVLLRCVTFLMQPVDWLCGLSSMPTHRVLSATFLGLIPPTVVVALTGGGLIDLLR